VPYFLIHDFSAGLDLRKSQVTAPAGTLRRIRNAHVTPGGEIEKRKAFVQRATVPDGCFGLAALGDTLYTFSNSVVSGNAEFQVMRLPTGTSYQLNKILDYDIFDGQLYVVARDTNNNVQHFYNGVYVPEGKGTSIRTYREKIHGVLDRELYFSAIGNPTDWTGTGSGFINLSTQDAESETLVGLEVYYDTLAIMSRRTVQIWNIDPDPLKYQQMQVLRSSGSRAALSIKQFGNGDVLYLGDSGIRSLRARDSSNAAAVSDIGSPIDRLYDELRRTQTEEYLASATGLIEPLSGRFWMVFPDRILVLSLFPSPKVTAWSTYEPGFTIAAAAVVDNDIALLDTNGNLYRYGPDVYDDTEAEILTPFMNADKPASFKRFNAIDLACEGTWKIYARMNFQKPNAEDFLGSAKGSTFLDGKFAFDGESTHIALRATTKSKEAAVLGSIAIHYDDAGSD